MEVAGLNRRKTRSTTMAKGQKRSNKEARKPKKETPKPAVAASSYLKPEHKKEQR